MSGYLHQELLAHAVGCVTQHPESQYLYDALYRLIEATGREHLALNDNSAPYKDGSFKQSQFELNDPTKLRQYKRTYEYDESGNMTQLRHLSPHSTHRFTRQVDIDPNSNRGLLHDDLNPTPDFSQFFDDNGNQTNLEHLNNISWNFRDNIASVTFIDRGGNNDAEYYIYDAGGQRTRKVKETWNGTLQKIEEKIYLGGVEIKRTRTIEGTVETQLLERYDLHVMDDKQRIAIVNHWTNDDSGSEAGSVVDPNDSGTHITKNRYQYSNHLGSASLELDGTQDANLISYEEYFPYGGTSFTTGSSQTDVSLKEYRYTGKERDDSTGLYYYGARYYAPWLGRWLSADPAGPVDGLNLYQYVSGNPVRLNDPSGTQEEKPKAQEATAQKVEKKVDQLTPQQKEAEAIKKAAEEKYKKLQEYKQPTLVQGSTEEKKNLKMTVVVYPSYKNRENISEQMAYTKRAYSQANVDVSFDVIVATKEQENTDTGGDNSFQLMWEGSSEDTDRIIARAKSEDMYSKDRPVIAFAEEFGAHPSVEATVKPQIDTGLGWAPEGSGVSLISTRGKSTDWVMAHESGHFFVGSEHADKSKFLMSVIPDPGTGKGFEMRPSDVIDIRSLKPKTAYQPASKPSDSQQGCGCSTPGAQPSKSPLLKTLLKILPW